MYANIYMYDFSSLGKINWSVYAHRLLSRFSVESNEYVPSFYKKQEVAEKLRNLKNARKT